MDERNNKCQDIHSKKLLMSGMQTSDEKLKVQCFNFEN